MYLPRIARLITPDPLAGLMVESTPYGYCFGNPIRFIDIFGLAPGSPINGGTLPTVNIHGSSGGLSGMSLMYFQSLQETLGNDDQDFAIMLDPIVIQGSRPPVIGNQVMPNTYLYLAGVRPTHK